MVAIGELRTRVTIQRQTRLEDSDGAGGATKTWASLQTVWGKIEPLSTYQMLQAEMTQNRATHKVTLRFGFEISGNDRLLLAEESPPVVMAIKGAPRDLDLRHEFVEMLCEMGAPT